MSQMGKICNNFFCLFGVSQFLGHSVIDKFKASEDMFKYGIGVVRHLRFFLTDSVQFNCQQ